MKAVLQEICDGEVSSENGFVRIQVEGKKLRKTGFASPQLQRKVRERIREDLTRDIVQRVCRVAGVKDIMCDIDLPYYS